MAEKTRKKDDTKKSSRENPDTVGEKAQKMFQNRQKRDIFKNDDFEADSSYDEGQKRCFGKNAKFARL